MSYIAWLATRAYNAGEHPISYAEGHVALLLKVHALVAAGRAENLASFPGYPIEMSDAGLARRIVGELLDAGWTPPGEIFEDDPPAFGGPR